MNSFSLPWWIFFGTLFSGLTIIGLLGNVIVIIIIGFDKSMRKSCMNILLLNLAVADILNLTVGSVEWTHLIIKGYQKFVFPSIFCPISRYLECVFLYSSIMTQLIVCVERFIAIIYPIHARRLCTTKNVIKSLIGMWLFVFIIALPYIFANVLSPTRKICFTSGMREKWFIVFKWIEFLFFYLLPAIIFIILYSKVAKSLWKNNPQLYEGSRSSSIKQNVYDTIKMRRNVVKMLVACVIIYFICYSPIQGLFIAKHLLNISLIPPYEFILIMNALAMTCSACNPLLYTLFSKKFRKRISEFLTCNICNNKQKFKILKRKEKSKETNRLSLTQFEATTYKDNSPNDISTSNNKFIINRKRYYFSIRNKSIKFPKHSMSLTLFGK
ncbi:Thyrotropin-releasing hormone receptor [Strongyloides ratti]|uniref:Thyrotropin-releasing hormone receptor n=1 Tax=Strongyloides ratti TaxID=34506 RepID=A0A090MXE0_STRRB|nr:Thyrotropin-releasing hormone receptor [Strongyloides ratti]CEF65269.1 Thyrotropin-releasing hormone receptor [Strongyloides ratti]